VSRRREAPMPPAFMEKLVDCAGSAVLVGGQALAFWVYRLGVVVPEGIPGISNDADFLSIDGDPRSVDRFARVLGGQTLFPGPRALTALLGQAFVPLPGDEVLNVDVLRQVFGLGTEAVAKRAVQAQLGSATFRVMHPLHVLQSRLLNLHKLPEKQNDKGLMQLRLAVDVVREHLRQVATSQLAAQVAAGRGPLQRLVSDVERLARDDAGRKVARRHGVHVADAIDPSLIPAGPFWTRRWPTLRTLMSPGYASRFEPPSAAAAKLARP
jgi:hypothetical protein